MKIFRTRSFYFRMKKITLLSLVLVSFLSLKANDDKEEISKLKAKRTCSSIKVDAKLNEKDWQRAFVATQFSTFSPTIGKKACQTSNVKVLYNDNALYISAELLDNQPDSILTQLSKRDEGNANADSFWVTISPYNDGQNYFKFEVTSNNVQSDIQVSASSEDRNWNAVWKSATRITNKGWYVEMEIPYSALRFPKVAVQKWGVNFWRQIRRNREISCWNPVDRTIGSWISQSGELQGIQNIDPPTRLAFYPYVSTVINNDYGTSSYSYSGGMDLKYGINDSYTLDVTLIPDFSQTKSDNNVLNLSPYETKFGENRAFFTEGTDLFNKAGIFYSRRIGNKPSKLNSTLNNLNENDSIIEVDSKEKMLNATKISGRNKSGLGIGFLNAMVDVAYVRVLDKSTHTKRTVRTQDFTNYNMLVLDKTIGDYSYINFSNTNRYNANEMDNVVATAYKFTDSNNKYGIYGKAALSVENDSSLTKSNKGYFSDFNIGRINGKLKYFYQFHVLSDDYNPNAMGYLSKNNAIKHQLKVEYNKYEQVWILLKYMLSLRYEQDRIFDGNKFSRERYILQTNGTFTNFISYGAWFEHIPKTHQDYNESRNSKYKFNRPKESSFGTWISSDYRKRLAFDANVGAVFPNNDKSQYGYARGNSIWFSIKPIVRVSDKLSLNHKFNYSKSNSQLGHVSTIETDSIMFGKRDVTKYINTFTGNFIFNNKSYLSLNLRHYWSQVEYEQYYDLLKSGNLNENKKYNENKDTNYNSFNIDLTYSYNFAPGSFINIMWKNEILSSGSNIESNFFNNFKNVLKQDQKNSVSLRVSYYLDYNKVKRKKKTT